MRMGRDLLLSLSLANLCFLNSWTALNNGFDAYFRRFHPWQGFILPVLCCELLATLLFFTAVRLMRRFRNPIVLNGSRLAFLAICLVPANLVRRELVHWSPAFI